MSNDQRVALVTGASRGIGLAIANQFYSLGYHVLTPGREELDLLSNSSIDAYASTINQIDIIVNNAGLNPLSDILELDHDDLDKTIQTNLLGPIRLVQSLVPIMINQRYGRVLNISSIWSQVTKPRRVSYSVSKSAINGLTRSLAVELSPHNILVNAVAPGFVNTALTKQNNSEEELRIIASNIPMGRLAEPEEISETVAFLCSEKNSYITGQTIFVDGGFTCI